MNTTSPVIWIDCNAWELDFYGLPHRIPWPADADPKLAEQTPFDTETLMRGVELLGPDAGDPWHGFDLATLKFEELGEAIQDNEFPAARALLDEIETLNPGMAFTLFHRAHVARHDGQIAQAIEYYQQALQKAPRLGFVWTNFGATLAAEGRRDEAVAAFQNGVRLNNNDAHALEGLAALRAAVKLVRDPKDPKSVAYVDIPTFAKMAEQQVGQLTAPEQLQGFAEQILRDGFAPAVAVMALEKLLQAQPENGRALLALAAAHGQLGQHDKALEAAIRFTEQNPTEAGGFFHLAQVRKAGGDEAGALADLDKALEIDPNLQPALGMRLGFADGQANAEHEKEVVAFAQKRRAWMPWLVASSMAHGRRDLPGAIRYAEKAHEIAPEKEEVLLHYCAVLGEAKEEEKLTKFIEPKVLSGEYTKRLDWNYAQALRQLGKTKEASSFLITSASAEGTPQDFQNAVESAVDFWTGVLVESKVPLELTRGGVIARPILLVLEDGDDGGVVLQSGRPVPAEANFTWRVPMNGSTSARIALKQGQTGSALPPKSFGTFVVSGLPPGSGSGHVLNCHVIATPQGALVFRANLNNRDYQVAWEAPADVAV